MKELLHKYAKVILKTCLKVEKSQPLFISANIERLDFVRIVTEEAYSLGVKEIYYDLTDPILKHEALLNLSLKDLKKHSYFNKKIWNTYAKKNAAFLMLASETPGLMKDIDPKKLNDIITYSYSTRKYFDDKRDKSELSWCIACVPTLSWAQELFPKEKDSVTKLWNTILDICHINSEDPVSYWQDKLKRLDRIASKLNDYNFKTLKYQNNLGTDFTIDLPKNHIWCSGYQELASGKKVLVNFPTEEIFTSPDRLSANGLVYSSKPLSYQDNLINNFNIAFQDGQAVSYQAEQGIEVLDKLLHSTENIAYLGEVALVEHSSSISQSNQVFLETLFDENAACHLALGTGFPECIKNGPKLTIEELQNKGINYCLNHVDFMIGTEDLNITGITYDDKEIPIFENGNYSKYFK